MEEVLTAFAVGTVTGWITLLIVLPLAQKIADFGLPSWPNLLWQAAVVAVVVNGVSVGAGLFSSVLAWVASAVVFWVLMVKWFDVDLFGAVVIVGVSFVTRFLVVMVLMGL